MKNPKFTPKQYSVSFSVDSDLLRPDLKSYYQYVGICLLASVEPITFKRFIKLEDNYNYNLLNRGFRSLSTLP